MLNNGTGLISPSSNPTAVSAQTSFLTSHRTRIWHQPQSIPASTSGSLSLVLLLRSIKLEQCGSDHESRCMVCWNGTKVAIAFRFRWTSQQNYRLLKTGTRHSCEVQDRSRKAVFNSRHCDLVPYLVSLRQVHSFAQLLH